MQILLGSWVLAAMAQVAVPIGPVPVSGQTLGVFLVGIALGPAHAVAAVVAYLAQGLSGLPVFAGGTAGPAVLIGPTAGYLIGFIPAAWIAGQISAQRVERRPAIAAATLVLATAVIYVFGAGWLSRFVGADRVVALGITPFLFGDALKIGISVLAAPFLAFRLRGEK